MAGVCNTEVWSPPRGDQSCGTEKHLDGQEMQLNLPGAANYGRQGRQPWPSTSSSSLVIVVSKFPKNSLCFIPHVNRVLPLLSTAPSTNRILSTESCIFRTLLHLTSVSNNQSKCLLNSVLVTQLINRQHPEHGTTTQYGLISTLDLADVRSAERDTSRHAARLLRAPRNGCTPCRGKGHAGPGR